MEDQHEVGDLKRTTVEQRAILFTETGLMASNYQCLHKTRIACTKTSIRNCTIHFNPGQIYGILEIKYSIK